MNVRRAPRIAQRGATVSLLLAAGLFSNCGDPAESGPARPNVLLITIDTLRADRLSLYGYERKTSPELDRWSQGAVVFDDANAPTSWTLPSLSSLLTGFYPSTHGATKFTSRLAPAFPTLAETLRNSGYDTAVVANHFFLQARHGLLQGFTHTDEEFARTQSRPHYTISSPGVTEKAERFLEQKASSPESKPFFLWVHYFDPHHVYFAHEGEAPDFGADPPDLYDAEIAFTDRSLGSLLQTLEQTGFAEDTLVVVTSDHGEEFLDHGEWQHGKSLYTELVRVPLVVAGPGIAPSRVDQAIRTIDVAPTILDFVGIVPDVPVAGRSLLPILRGTPLPAAPLLAELELYPGKFFTSVREGPWKLIVNDTTGDQELYHLEQDPGERSNRAASDAAVASRLRSLLDSEQERARDVGRGFVRASELTMNPSDLEDLGNLGYLGDDK